MAFRNYGKVHRLGKEETEGILIGTCHIQEKIDGANTSIWMEGGQICMGTRTRKLPDEGDDFNGFVSYVRAHEGIKKCLEEHPDYRLYGEWLVKHTIDYKATVYKKFYLFDIWQHDHDLGTYLSAEAVKLIGEKYEIDTVPMHGHFVNPTMEILQELVGKSQLGDKGEGIVIKNLDFVNAFGETVFAKIVTESFKEDNAVTFGGNNKYSDCYWEVWAVNKYMTLARVRKIMEKIQPTINERLDMKHIPRIVNTAYHDMLTEEIWEMQSKMPTCNFKALARIAQKKAKQVFVDILNDSISVADRAVGWEPNDTPQ